MHKTSYDEIATELREILRRHALWLDGEGGERANLRGADMSGADLRGVDLSGADLSGADMSVIDLCGAALCDADMPGADLRRANLRDASCCDAIFRNADLCGADLRNADLRGADLRGTDFAWADLRRANLTDADLRGADLRLVKLLDCHMERTRGVAYALVGTGDHDGNGTVVRAYGVDGGIVLACRCFQGSLEAALMHVKSKKDAALCERLCRFVHDEVARQMQRRSSDA